MAGDGEQVAVLLDPRGEVVFWQHGKVGALGCSGADKGLCFGKVCLWVEGLRVEVRVDDAVCKMLWRMILRRASCESAMVGLLCSRAVSALL